MVSLHVSLVMTEPISAKIKFCRSSNVLLFLKGPSLFALGTFPHGAQYKSTTIPSAFKSQNVFFLSFHFQIVLCCKYFSLGIEFAVLSAHKISHVLAPLIIKKNECDSEEAYNLQLGQ